MVVFTFSGLEDKYHIWENFVQKIKIASLKLKLGTLTNSNMQTSIVMFSVLRWKYSFRAKFVQKINIVSLG